MPSYPRAYTVVLILVGAALRLDAQAEPYIGQIVMFAGNFAPRGWAFCEGQLLPINQNTALFSILGTTYGGDGRVTFALPDLRGRVVIHPGAGPGLTSFALGSQGGTETITTSVMTGAQTNVTSTKSCPATFLATSTAAKAARQQMAGCSTLVRQGPSVSAPTKQSVRDPYLAINFIIAMQGIFPSRD